jgi:hypothetical protein
VKILNIFIKITLLFLIVFTQFSVEAKPRANKKNCPSKVYIPSSNYKGAKCPPKRKIKLQKYY